MNTEITNCYICNIDDANFYDEENGYTYVKCNTCSLIYLNPRPISSDISEAHKTGMHRGDKVIHVTGRFKKSKISTYITILKDFYTDGLSSFNNKSWLDIGCGNGEFLEALKSINKNIKLKGSEPNEIKASTCLKRGLDVEWIAHLDKHTVKYDYISLLNVYSHLPDPVEFISKIKERLNPHGELFLQTGHSSHLPSTLHHKPYLAPDHLSFANREIVEGILVKMGFEIIHTNIYRNEQFPSFKTPKIIFIEALKILLNKGGDMHNFFPKHPNRNMYIRAKLVE